jgi:hypothetical protein
VLEPVVARYWGKVSHLYFRADAPLPTPRFTSSWKPRTSRTRSHCPANDVLQESIGYLLKRPVGRPPIEVRRYHASFSYRAQSWKMARRVVAKVEWHPSSGSRSYEGEFAAGANTLRLPNHSLRRQPMSFTIDPGVRTETTIRPDHATVFVSLELSRSKWLITALLPCSDKMSKYSVDSGDGTTLLDRLARLRARAEPGIGTAVHMVVIQEAGLDGFRIHRLLESNGMESHVVEPASIAVPPARSRNQALNAEPG